MDFIFQPSKNVKSRLENLMFICFSIIQHITKNDTRRILSIHHMAYRIMYHMQQYTFQRTVAAPPPVAIKPAVAPLEPPQTTIQPVPYINSHQVQPLSPRQPAEIDETRPGGVKTLTRNFEHKVQPVKAPVTQSHFEKPAVVKPQPTVTQLQVEDAAEKTRRISAVTFSENVSRIFKMGPIISNKQSAL